MANWVMQMMSTMGYVGLVLTLSVLPLRCTASTRPVFFVAASREASVLG
jgi:hypothetical protein